MGAAVFCLSPQRTGWSALHFSAERSDASATELILKKGANAHLKDKVCNVPLIHSSSLVISMKDGLTPLKIAELMDYGCSDDMDYRPDDKAVIALLSDHCEEELTTVYSTLYC